MELPVQDYLSDAYCCCCFLIFPWIRCNVWVQFHFYERVMGPSSVDWRKQQDILLAGKMLNAIILITYNVFRLYVFISIFFIFENVQTNMDKNHYPKSAPIIWRYLNCIMSEIRVCIEQLIFKIQYKLSPECIYFIYSWIYSWNNLICEEDRVKYLTLMLPFNALYKQWRAPYHFSASLSLLWFPLLCD